MRCETSSWKDHNRVVVDVVQIIGAIVEGDHKRQNPKSSPIGKEPFQRFVMERRYGNDSYLPVQWRSRSPMYRRPCTELFSVNSTIQLPNEFITSWKRTPARISRIWVALTLNCDIEFCGSVDAIPLKISPKAPHTRESAFIGKLKMTDLHSGSAYHFILAWSSTIVWEDAQSSNHELHRAQVVRICSLFLNGTDMACVGCCLGSKWMSLSLMRINQSQRRPCVDVLFIGKIIFKS